jgi:hypothetical protein
MTPKMLRGDIALSLKDRWCMCRKTWTRLCKADKELIKLVGDSIKINDNSQLTSCAKPEVMTQIIWSLPSKVAKAYRMQCARIITRFQMGDQSLHSELDRNKVTTDANGGLPQFRAVEVDIADQETIGPFGKRKLALADIEIDERRFKLREDRQIATMTYANHAHELLEKLGLLCDRNKMAISDSIMNNLVAAQNSQRMLCGRGDQPKQVAEIMEQDLNLPPHVIRKYRVMAGKEAATAFRAKHGPKAEFSTVDRFVDGANREVKMYNPPDIPMVTKAIEDYLSQKGVM